MGGHGGNIRLIDILTIHVFGQSVLSKQTIRMFVSSALRRCSWIGKISSKVVPVADRPPVGKLFAAVKGDGFKQVFRETAVPSVQHGCYTPVLASGDDIGGPFLADFFGNIGLIGLRPHRCLLT